MAERKAGGTPFDADQRPFTVKACGWCFAMLVPRQKSCACGARFNDDDELEARIAALEGGSSPDRCSSSGRRGRQSN